MKKYILGTVLLLLSILLIKWYIIINNIRDCSRNGQPDQETYKAIQNIIIEHENFWDNNKLFVEFAILWIYINKDCSINYYLVTNWQSFYIDERWNLNNGGWFWGIPTTITIERNWDEYELLNYEIAKDWNEYDTSTKKMFSKEAYKTRKDGKYMFINDKTLLKQAEEYFGITIIPENENKFECNFCDKLRYYNQTPESDEKLDETGDLYFNYTTKDNWKNTIYFSSDWSFEAKGSRDEWTWTRTFWQDENTIIVLNNNINHVYDRYIITNQTEDSLNTILEIIQRR